MSATAQGPTGLATAHGDLVYPAFFPDATAGAVRSVDSADVEEVGISALMVNLLHLSSRPGTSVISAMGGLRKFMGWRGPVLCDSGGFQVLSLLTEQPGMGKVSRDGLTYRLQKGGPTKKLTPESCIRRQVQMGADVLFCLDYCTRPEASAQTQRESVDFTVEWASRCQDEFKRLMDSGKYNDEERPPPLLFGIVQGGEDRALRQECADGLLELGFDGYGFGGWPIGEDGLLLDMVRYVAELLPPDTPKHGLGIGKPENLAEAHRAGYGMFDCTIPTRDARRGRLYAFTGPMDDIELNGTDFYEYVYIQDERYVRDGGPVDESCDAVCCTRYSRAYLRHAFNANEALGHRLATIHNLRFYTRLTSLLGAKSG